MRIGAWLCLVAGAACLIAAALLGVHAIQQNALISAYQGARPCVAGAPAGAGCLRSVDGAITGVTESPGGYRIPADYALDVRTGSQSLHLTFTSDSPMLGYAADGDHAVVTMWRGIPVAVRTDGRSDVTTSVPRTAVVRDVGNSEQAAAVGACFVLGGLGISWKRRAGDFQRQSPSPALATGMWTALLGAVVVEIGAIALGGKPSRVGPDVVATGAGLAVVLGLAAWTGISQTREARHAAARSAPAQGLSAPAQGLSAPAGGLSGLAHAAQPLASSAWEGGTPRRPRTRRVNRARVLARRAGASVPILLASAVLFGVFLTSHDGPPARAYRHAPACAGEANLATCAGDFTAVVNGVRTPVNGSDFAEVSYATGDGAINTWAQFDGNAPAIARAARADQLAGTPLSIRVWRRALVGADFGGGWHWADGNPPGNTNPTLLLGISFALLLLVVRLRVHRRTGPTAGWQGLIADDLGQAAVAAGGTVLLASGFWPGAILVLAALAWLGVSAGRNTQRRPATLAALRPAMRPHR